MIIGSITLKRSKGPILLVPQSILCQGPLGKKRGLPVPRLGADLSIPNQQSKEAGPPLFTYYPSSLSAQLPTLLPS